GSAPGAVRVGGAYVRLPFLLWWYGRCGWPCRSSFIDEYSPTTWPTAPPSTVSSVKGGTARAGPASRHASAAAPSGRRRTSRPHGRPENRIRMSLAGRVARAGPHGRGRPGHEFYGLSRAAAGEMCV